jgi:NADH oxidoreductase Hcr
MVETWSPDKATAAPSATQNNTITLRCIAIDDNSPDVKTFCFETLDDQPLLFEAGQFVILKAQIGGSCYQRAYTLASAPALGRSICEITIKRDGLFTQWLFGSFAIGQTIEASRPMGEFTLKSSHHDPLLFLSGGVGITPMLSLSRMIASHNLSLDVVFIHAARSDQDILFFDELKDIEATLPAFRYLQCVDTGSLRADLNEPIGLSWLKQTVPDIAERAVYCCGPQGFMDNMQLFCQMLGVDTTQFISESFGGQPSALAFASPSPSGLSDLGREQFFAIELQSSQRQFEASSHQSILQAYEAQQIPVMAMCRNGTCRSCARKLISGDMAEIYPQTLSEEERAMGYFLTCACRPTSDVVIAD